MCREVRLGEREVQGVEGGMGRKKRREVRERSREGR